MQILLITNKLPYPQKDGGAIATLSLAKNLSKLAEKFDILAINTSKHYFDIKNIPEQLKKYINFYDYFLNTDIKIVKLIKNLLFSNLPYNAERFINEGFADKIKKRISENNYDIIQFEGLYVLPYIELIRKNSTAIISYRAHNIEHEIWKRTAEQTTSFFKKKYVKILTNRIKKLEKKFINKYDLLIPITERDGEKLNKMGNLKPSLTIPTGVNINDYITDNSITEKNSIFHIGSLDWSPNQEGLLWFIDNCWTKIQEEKPEIKFYIAGRNAPEWFVNRIKHKNIVFLGEVDDAHKFMNSKSIMIVPLLSGSGMRIKIIEGMALSKAIISTSIGVEGIPATNNENIIIADKAVDFVKQTIELSNQPEKTNKIGMQAKLFVSKKFDNFAIAKKLYYFYDKHLKIND